ncbi:MAG: hypothetical protein WCG81_22145 [Candidatus Angelobacter sp.]
MKLSRFVKFGVVIMVTLGLGKQFNPTTFWLQAQSPSNVLTPQLLQTSGAGHLPSYVSTLPALVQYQQKLPLHQTLTITWDSLPGHTEPIPKSTADTMTLSGNFTLVTRTQRQNGSPGGTGLDVIQDSLVVVAVTNSGEIRGLKAQGDRRTSHGEAQPGGQAEEWVSPKVTLAFPLPDDPLIRYLVFLKPVFSSTGQLSLLKLGSMDLWNTTPTGS